MKRMLFISIVCILILLSFFNIRNYIINYKNNIGISIDKYIRDNTGRSIANDSELNLYFVVTPIDCKCLRYFLTDDFVDKIKNINNNKTIKVNYIVSGDYTKTELENYISSLENIDDFFIDKNNSAKMFLFSKFKTVRTPFLFILDRNGVVKYWQDIRSNIRTEDICTKLFKILEAIS